MVATITEKLSDETMIPSITACLITNKNYGDFPTSKSRGTERTLVFEMDHHCRFLPAKHVIVRVKFELCRMQCKDTLKYAPIVKRLHVTRCLRLNLPCLFLLIAVDKLEHFTCIVFLIYTSAKAQSLIDLFVFNCIRNSSQDIISDANSVE